jgi:hypothetical protein
MRRRPPPISVRMISRPPRVRGLLRDCRSTRWRQLLRSRCSAFEAAPTSVFGSRIVLNLTRGDPHDVDRIADHVGGALLAFGASGNIFT